MEELDRRILSLLSADGRISYTDIGRETGLSTSAAQQRVRRLEQRGVITGYTARIDPSAVGRLITAFVAIRPTDASQADDIPTRLRDIAEVVSCFTVAGDASHQLMVQCESPLALEHLLTQIRTTARASTTTTLVLSVPFSDRAMPLPRGVGDQ